MSAGLWVKIPVDSAEGVSDAYYWNPETQATCWTLPPGVDATWVAQRQDGTMYYWNTTTRSATWDVPRSGSSPAAAAATNIGSPAPGPARPPPSGWQFETVFRGAGVPDMPPGAAPNLEADHDAIGAAANPQDANAAEGAGAGNTETANWVEVEADEEIALMNCQTYFWNFVKGITTWTLPPGVRARWRAYQTPEGRAYYVDAETGQATWELPGIDRMEASSSSRWIEPGAAMMIQGLTENVQYNKQAGRVVCVQGERVWIKLPDCLGGALLGVPPRNLCPLENSTIVELQGLSTAHLNGEVCTVAEQHPEGCRYSVKLRDGCVKSVQANKVVPRCRLWNINLSASYAWLQWRKEQDLLFIDSCGQHRRFSLHLPCTFLTTQREATSSEPVRWPMMVYMHGTGGSSFFTHSKKTLRSDGLQFAAHKFVVVSPQCDWTWRETPKPWVAELVEALRAADWIDHRRVYLTGCSMGGMSTWEVSAMRTDLFAAIAPVAGHHQADRTAPIAQALRGTPIFVVHSRHDETCSLRLEEPLYTELDRCGNRRLQVNVADNIDHCSMYERAYCDDTTLYDWLLMFRDV